MSAYTIRDVARLAGVSVTTVSRVLNHRPDVNEQTRQAVERVIAECHFVGNRNARGLKQSRDAIGLIVRGRSNPFLSALAEAILEHAKSLPDYVLTEYIDEADDEFLTALHMSQQTRIRGFIFVGSRIDDRAKVLENMEVPLVFTTVNGRAASFRRASSVAIDDRAMGRAVAEAMLSAGHRNIAVFGSDPLAGDSLSARFQGFCDAFTDQGLIFMPSWYRVTRFSLQAGYDAALSFFADHPEMTALFAMSDTVALGAMRALQDLGKNVPSDLSVVGFDGIDLGRFTAPRLTTVEQPVEEIARQSIHLLLDMLEKNASPRHLLVSASFRRRESLAAPPSSPAG